MPRTKTQDQIFAELQALYDAGYRGHVDFVDDNFIGNRKHVRPMMPKLKEWLQKHDYPFEFTTEASINIADDDDMLQSMKDANFFGIFVGIESPDPETLIQMRKKQNTKRNIAESIHKIYGYGMFVTAGFILGFDTEKVSIAHSMTDFIEDMLRSDLHGGPALRAARHAAHAPPRKGRPAAQGPRHHAGRAGGRPVHARLQLRHQAAAARHPHRLQDRAGERVHARKPMRGGSSRLSAMLDRSGRPKQLADGDIRKGHGVDVLYKIIRPLPEVREPFWKTFVEIGKNNPGALRQIVTLMAMYLHLGPFSKHVIGEIDRRIPSWTKLRRRPRPRSPPTARRWRRTRSRRPLIPANAGIHAQALACPLPRA